MQKKYNLLIIEDDEVLLELFSEYLLRRGYRLDTASSFEQARQKVHDHVYDLAILDLKLPDGNGIELLEQFREESPDTISIVVSGNATIELIADAVSLGAFDFLIKPVQLEKIALVVENALNKREMALQNKKLISELQIAKKNLEASVRTRTEQLKKSEHKFRTLYDSAPDVYYTVDTQGNIIDCNKMAAEFFGTTKKELKTKHLLDLYTSDNFELVTSMVPTPDGEGGKVRHQEVLVKKVDGTVANVEINSNLLYYSDNRVIGALTIQRDITARKRAEEQLRESEERYRTIFHTVEVALIELDFSELRRELEKLMEHGIRNWKDYLLEHPEFVRTASEMMRIVDVNEATVQLFKAPSIKELLGDMPQVFAEPGSSTFQEFLAAIAQGKRNFQAEGRFRRLSGEKFHALVSLAIPSRDAKFKNMLVSLVDISDRIKAEEEKDLLLDKLHQLNKQLENLAVTDGLTRIYNHRFFMETLNREFSRAQRHDQPLSLLMADIDNFKNFNDSYGHHVGDKVLVNVAEILRSSRRGSDIVARYGGEEFVVLLPDTNIEHARAVAEKIRDKVEKTVIREGDKKLRTTISLGYFGLEKGNLKNPKDLLIMADKALYQAKRSGKNKVCTVDKALV